MNAITRLFIEGVITNLLDENINENKILGWHYFDRSIFVTLVILC